MEQKKFQFLRLAGVIAGATIFISFIIVAIGLILHWDQPIQFSNGFVAMGGIMIVLSAFSFTGEIHQRAYTGEMYHQSNVPLNYGEIVGQESTSQRIQQMATDFYQKHEMLITFLSVGILLISIAIFLSNFG